MIDRPFPLDPTWLAHRFEPNADAFHFVNVSRHERSEVAFLTDELLGENRERRIFRRSDISSNAHSTPCHFVFHSAYCCSTLVAKALDVPGVASSLKEPQLLNDLVGWRQRGTNPQQVSQILDLSLQLLNRPFNADEAMIIKPSNVINGLIPTIIRLRPNARILLLHAPLEAYLASIARKGMWGRLWARELLTRQLVDGLITPLGFESRDHILHTDLQAAAVGWLAQHKMFAEMAKRWPDQVRTMNSEDLVAHPFACLERLGQFFGLDWNDGVIENVVSTVFSRDAKNGENFVPGQRAIERASGVSMHTEELEKVETWAMTVAEHASIPMILPAPL